MVAWQQSELPLIDPTEPRTLPQDGRAWFTLNWLSPAGRLNRQMAFEADELETVLRLTAGQPDLYMSQCFLDRPVRQHPFIKYVTHAYVDLDTYRQPHLAGRSRDDLVRDIRLHCDDAGIPQPSAIIGSGRGISGKWYLTNPVGREGVGNMVGANRTLVRGLVRFGADPKATDATRVLRVTGSVHTGARRLVELLHLEQRDGHTVTYDADWFVRSIAPGVGTAPAADMVLPPVADLDRDGREHSGGRVFRREGWHWAIVLDCYTLARLRWGGVVPAGHRDIFGHVIACQMARIFWPATLYREIVAAVSLILPAGYVARDLASHCSTLMARARQAAAGRDWTQLYRYSKSSLIELLEITPDEERLMCALISDGEGKRRDAVRHMHQRRAAGMIERGEYRAPAEQRRLLIAVMRGQGLSGRAIAGKLGCSEAEVRRLSVS